MLIVAVCVPLSAAADSARLVPVDEQDPRACEVSASRAFYAYLRAVDAQNFREAREHALDPQDTQRRADLTRQLLSFMRARVKTPVRNEALVVRTAGAWALVVYQFDTTIAGRTARVITTAWMVKWDGYWRQFIVAPKDESFWETRRSDYERLQQWFDDHAGELGARV